MRIGGLQKMTLLDYPGKVACTVFLSGCNFRCPFCHNSGLLDGAQEDLSQQELLAFLEKRRGILDGVCITGGEPTLQPDLPQLLAQIKAMGFAVKLDTNGYRPEVLEALLAQDLVDYVAMDIKNSPEGYSETTGRDIAIEKIESSIRLLLQGQVAYEFRTTVAQPLHTRQSVFAMGQWVSDLSGQAKVKAWYIQPFVQRDSVLCGGLQTPQGEELTAFRGILSPFAEKTEIRGI